MKGRTMPDDTPLLWVHADGAEPKICLTWNDAILDVDSNSVRCGTSTRALSLRGAELIAAELTAAIAAVREHLAHPAAHHTECDPAAQMRRFVKALEAGGNTRQIEQMYLVPASQCLAYQQAKEQELLAASLLITE